MKYYIKNNISKPFDRVFDEEGKIALYKLLYDDGVLNEVYEELRVLKNILDPKITKYFTFYEPLEYGEVIYTLI